MEARKHLTGYGFLLPSRVSVRLGHECLDLLRYRNGSCDFFGFFEVKSQATQADLELLLGNIISKCVTFLYALFV